LKKRDLYLGDSEFGHSEGEIHGKTFIRHVTESDYFSNGIRFADELIDRLIDEDIDAIVVVHDNTRYMSTIEDWQEYGRTGTSESGLDEDIYYTYLPFSYMTEA
jgi:hypothetical protein